MTLGEKLSALRKNCGMTQTQLGEKLNLSAQAVSKWENNLAEPDITTLRKLAFIYDVSIEEIVNCTSEGETPAADAIANDAESKNETAEDKEKSLQLLFRGFDLVKKIQVIKLLMDYINLPDYCYVVSKNERFGLAEAKNAVENLPFIIRFEDSKELEEFKSKASMLGCSFDQVIMNEKNLFIKEYVAPSQKTKDDMKQLFKDMHKGVLVKHFIVSILFALIPVAICTALFIIFGTENNVLRNGLIFFGIAYVLFSFVFQWRYDTVPVNIMFGPDVDSAFIIFLLMLVALVVAPFTFPVSIYKRIVYMRENDVDELHRVVFDKMMSIYVKGQDEFQ